jgi:hypothetical protein
MARRPGWWPSSPAGLGLLVKPLQPAARQRAATRRSAGHLAAGLAQLRGRAHRVRRIELARAASFPPARVESQAAAGAAGAGTTPRGTRNERANSGGAFRRRSESRRRACLGGRLRNWSGGDDSGHGRRSGCAALQATAAGRGWVMAVSSGTSSESPSSASESAVAHLEGHAQGLVVVPRADAMTGSGSPSTTRYQSASRGTKPRDRDTVPVGRARRPRGPRWSRASCASNGVLPR